MKPTEKRLVIDIDKDLVIGLKAVAACRQIPIKRVLEQVLKHYLNRTDVFITWKEEED